MALLAQLVLRADVPVERHRPDAEFAGTVRTPGVAAAAVRREEERRAAGFAGGAEVPTVWKSVAFGSSIPAAST